MKYDLDYQESNKLHLFRDQIKSRTYLSKNPLIQFVYKRFFHELLTLLAAQTFHNLLDVGCGEGVALSLISKNFPDVEIVGVDVDREALRIGARMLYPNLSFIRADARLLPFQKVRFDVVLGIEVLEHSKDPSKILVEMRRVASEKIIITVPNSRVFRILNALRLKGRIPDHVQEFDMGSLDHLTSQLTGARLTRVVNPWIISSIDVSEG